MDVLANILGIITSILAIGTILFGALYAIFPTLRPRIILALRKYWKYLAAVFVLFAFGYIVGSFSSNCKDCKEVESAAPVSLLSANYMYADFNPHLIDLRTADTNGIPVGDDFSLRFYDIWLTTPNNVPDGYQAQIKVYADPERKLPIGETERIALENNKTLIEEIEVIDDESRIVQNAWAVQPDWLDDYLTLELITYYEDQQVNSHLTSILLKNDGTAWMADTPIASYASIIYSVNNGPQQVLNLPDAADRGINAGSGDEISINEVWYHAQASSSDETTHARLEGYLTNRDTGSYNGDLLCKTDYSLVKEGVFPIDLANTSCRHDSDLAQFSWTIPDDEQELIMTYLRKDRTILDRLVLHLNGSDGAPGLPLDLPPGVPSVDIVSPIISDNVAYYSFEECPLELNDWVLEAGNGMACSSDYKYDGEQSLAIDASLVPRENYDTSDGTAQLELKEAIAEDQLLVMRVFVPQSASEQIYAGLYLWDEAKWEDGHTLNLVPGKWTTLAWSTSNAAPWQQPAEIGVIFSIPKGAPENLAAQYFLEDESGQRTWGQFTPLEPGKWATLVWHTQDAPPWDNAAILGIELKMQPIERPQPNEISYQETVYLDLVEILEVGDIVDSLDSALVPWKVYHFEDVTDLPPSIEAVADVAGNRLTEDPLLVTGKEHLPYGLRSLRMNVDLQPYKNETGFGGISFDLGEEYIPIDAILANVYIPPRDDIDGAENFYVNIIADSRETVTDMQTGSEKELAKGYYSHHMQIPVGEWTPIFWGTGYANGRCTEEDESGICADGATFLWDEWTSPELNRLTIRIWRDGEAYKGPIYLDHIALYQLTDSQK